MKTIVAAIAVLSAGAASAATTGFDLTISHHSNGPVFRVTNTSVSALLTRFTFTVGDADTYNFDRLFFTNPNSLGDGGSQTSVGIDTDVNGGLRADLIDVRFTGFDPGEFSKWETDLDRDPDRNVPADYRVIFGNNGDAPNSVGTAFFDDGSIATVGFPDVNQYDYAFSAMGVSPALAATAAVPLPAGLPLLAGAMGVAGLVLRRRAG
jgi:hypothetical protein